MRWNWRWSVGVCTGAAVVLFTSQYLRRAPSAHLTPQATVALAATGMTPLGGGPAPNFTLTDQNGAPVSLDAFRGRAVILAFLDPVCWSECPMQAQEMKAVDGLLGPARASRVALVAVAANPIYHSVTDVLRFTQQEDLAGVGNWTFATSSSLPALQKVWASYYETVTVPQNDMVDHTQLFYIIGPGGTLDYVSNPETEPAYFQGTIQLLAAYVLKVLHASPQLEPTQPAMPAPAPSNPIQTPGPVAADFWSPTQGLLIVNAPPYQLVYSTTDGGATWTDEGPPGIGKQGGLAWSWGAPGSAWILIRPFYWMANTSVDATSTAGATWVPPAVLAGAPPSGSTSPVAGAGPERAGVLSGGRLWTTDDGGQHWSAAAVLPSGVTEPGLGWAPSGGTPWLGGGGAARGTAWLWSGQGPGWTSVRLPVPAAMAGASVVSLAPSWTSAQDGLDVLAGTLGSETMVWADTTNDGGRSWTAALPPLAAVNPFGGGVQEAGGDVYALSARGQVEIGAPGTGTWAPDGVPVPAGGVRALDFLSARQGWVIAGGRAGTDLYRTTDGGAHWQRVVLPAVG